MTTLTLEAYARLLAHIACRRTVRLEDILADLHIDAGALREAEPKFREELAAAWAGRKGIVAMKFAAALGAELARLGPLGGDDAPHEVAPGEPAVPVPLADARPREPEVPSYLQAAPPRVPIGPVVPTPMPEVAPPPLVISHVTAEPASSAPVGGTANMDLSAIVAAVRQGSLPFKPADASSAAATGPHEEPRPAPERPTSAAAHLGGTVNADLSAIMAAVEHGSLPFKPTEGASPVGTVEPDEQVDFALLPLETYASVSGTLARGASRAEALAKHGLHAEVFDRLAKAWAQRFQREPHLLERFKELARSSAAGRPGT